MKLDKYLVKGFVGLLLAKNFDAATKIPWFHEEWWELCCSDHKAVSIAAPRGHAKSTAITLGFCLASVLFRDRSYAMIVSDTETQACLFLGQIKAELMENEELRKLFGVDCLLKENERDIIVKMVDGHQFRITARGSNQPLRGLLWRGQRPDLIICDDLENDEIVLNPDRREKFRRWFYGTLLPCLSHRGIIRVVGTILHLDSFLERTMPGEHSRDTVNEELKMWSTRSDNYWKSVKYRAHNEDMSEILWPARWTKEKLIRERNIRVEEGFPDVYAQEFLNNPLDQSKAYFRAYEFQPMSEDIRNAIQSRSYELTIYIGVDLAVSTKDRADWSAFVVIGIDANNKMFVIDVIRERIDSHEIVETIFYLENTYHPELFFMEKGQITRAIGPFLKEEAFKRGIFPQVHEITPDNDKISRARSIQGRMRSKGCWFDTDSEWFGDFQSELLAFNKGKFDDQVDAFAIIGLGLNKMDVARTPKEIEDDDYDEFVREQGDHDSGRSKTTGY